MCAVKFGPQEFNVDVVGDDDNDVDGVDGDDGRGLQRQFEAVVGTEFETISLLFFFLTAVFWFLVRFHGLS